MDTPNKTCADCGEPIQHGSYCEECFRLVQAEEELRDAAGQWDGDQPIILDDTSETLVSTDREQLIKHLKHLTEDEQ